jgi:hypothetical protein
MSCFCLKIRFYAHSTASILTFSARQPTILARPPPATRKAPSRLSTTHATATARVSLTVPPRSPPIQASPTSALATRTCCMCSGSAFPRQWPPLQASQRPQPRVSTQYAVRATLSRTIRV